VKSILVYLKKCVGTPGRIHSFIYSFIFLLLPLEQRASVKRFDLLQFLNVIDSRWDSLDGGSARHKAATKHKHGINVD
jgi:hypothetical protein